MKFKKILALTASLLVVATFTVGCGNLFQKEDEKKRNTEGLNIGEDDFTENLDIQDYDGYNFRILIRPGQVKDQYLEEGSADPIEDAVYKRNLLVEELYNIKITATESSNSNYEIDAVNSILAGDDAYDAIFPHARAAFAYAAQDALLNINEINSIKLENEWWSQDIIDSCNINGNLYVLDGDISLARYKGVMCLFFNKRIFDELGLEYPYELISDGEWTFDQFAEYVKKGAKDLNGDGVWDTENDQYGLSTTLWQAPISILYTGGQKIYDKNDQGIPQLTLYSQKTVSIFDDFFDLVEEKGNYIFLEDGSTAPSFRDGRVMFQDTNLGSAQSYRDMDDNFGIIPYPKYTEDDEYATIVNGFNHLLIIPRTVYDPERTGNIIEALCAIGSRDVVPVFYDVSLKTKFSRDEESEDMIDIIRDSVVYDLGYVSAGSFSSVGRNLAVNNQDFTSYYKARESKALDELEKFMESYGGMK